MDTVKRYVLCIFFMHLFMISGAQKASIGESKQSFRTYPYGDPDPVVRMSRIYPYFRFDGYSAQGEMMDWNIITLENKYIKVLVAPEIGGKVLGAFEKGSGRDFLYFNKVIKFRDIAMRGPWTSGGIEFNFGSIGHAPMTSSPVDYLTRTNEDGSSSCFVAAMDLSSRTNWMVEIKLPAGGAYFETNGTWSNPGNLATSLYHWSTGAAAAGKDLRFCFPGSHYIGHNGDVHEFPVNKAGRDISVYGNNDFGRDKSYHVLGKYSDYFGWYWENSDFGAVHWADYGRKPGKKIWIWSLARDGQIWEDLLTDTDLGNKQYVEIQSGFLFNQASMGSTLTPFKNRAFQPNTSEYFTESWYPVHETGTITGANAFGALAIENNKGKVQLRFCANRHLDTKLRILSESGILFETDLILNPMDAVEYKTDINPEGEFSVWIGDDMIADFPLSQNDLSRPLEIQNDFEWNSLWGNYTRAIELDRQRDYMEAKKAFEQCLEKDKYFVPALNALAGQYYRQMDYRESLDYVRKPLALDAYDPQANFLFGLISRKSGKYYDALDGFAMASKSLEYKSPACVQTAEMYMLMQQWQKALHFADLAVETNRENEAAWQAQLMVLRYRGDTTEAFKVIEGLLRVNPLNHFAGFEKYLWSKNTADKLSFTSGIQNEFPHESYLEIAAKYQNLGLFSDAIEVLELAPGHAIVNLWKAWNYKKLGQDENASLAFIQFENGPVAFVFPFRTETAEILESYKAESNNWKIRYYMGLIYWSKGRIEKAKEYFQECGNQPEYFAFYLTRNNLMKDDRNYDAEGDLLRAWRLDQKQWRSFMMLSEHYLEAQNFPEALEWSRKGYTQYPDNYILAYQFAKSLLVTGKYKESLDILVKTTILPNEGARYGRVTYRQACIMDALNRFKRNDYKSFMGRIEQSRTWPENLGVGKPFDTDERIEDYLESLYMHKNGLVETAKILQERIVDYSLRSSHNSSGRYLEAIVLRNMGKEDEARQLLENWEKTAPENLVAAWCLSKFTGKKDESGQILKEIRKASGGTLFDPASRDPDFPLILAISEME